MSYCLFCLLWNIDQAVQVLKHYGIPFLKHLQYIYGQPPSLPMCIAMVFITQRTGYLRCELGWIMFGCKWNARWGGICQPQKPSTLNPKDVFVNVSLCGEGFLMFFVMRYLTRYPVRYPQKIYSWLITNPSSFVIRPPKVLALWANWGGCAYIWTLSTLPDSRCAPPCRNRFTAQPSSCHGVETQL